MMILATIDWGEAVFAGVVSAIVVTGSTWMAARRAQASGKIGGKEETLRLMWTGEYRAGMDQAKRALEACGASLISQDPGGGLIIAKTKATWSSFGLTIRVQFHGPVGATIVDLAVGQPTAGKDFGRSRKFLDLFGQEWERLESQRTSS